jgi:hypothetical protein
MASLRRAEQVVGSACSHAQDRCNAVRDIRKRRMSPFPPLRSHDEIEASLLCLLADELSRIPGGAVDDEFTCHWMSSHNSCLSSGRGPAGKPS